MRGFPSHNYPLFNRVAAELRAQGYEIVNPAEVEGTSEGVSREICMLRDFEVLVRCDGVAALAGWEQSPGACTEVALAWSLNLPLYDVVTDEAGKVAVCPSKTSLLHIPRETQYYNERPLVGLCGYAQAGKDTAAQFMMETRAEYPIESGWSRVAFADTLRDMLYALNPIGEVSHLLDGDDDMDVRLTVATLTTKRIVDCAGWDHAKTTYPEIRKLLQRLGTEAGRDILGEHTWVHLGEQKIEAANSPVVVTDVRFPNELQMIRRRGGVVAWVQRPGVGPVNEHASEHSVLASDADYVINNDGDLGKLRYEVAKFLKWHHVFKPGAQPKTEVPWVWAVLEGNAA